MRIHLREVQLEILPYPVMARLAEDKNRPAAQHASPVGCLPTDERKVEL